MPDTTDLLNDVISSDASTFESNFNDIMAERVREAIETKYAEMYPGAAEEVDEEQ